MITVTLLPFPFFLINHTSYIFPVASWLFTTASFLTSIGSFFLLSQHSHAATLSRLFRILICKTSAEYVVSVNFLFFFLYDPETAPPRQFNTTISRSLQYMHSLTDIHACNTLTLHDKDYITIAIPETYLDCSVIQSFRNLIQSQLITVFFFNVWSESWDVLQLGLRNELEH